MTINDHITEDKLQHDFNREAAKTSALSSREIDKGEYVIGGEILPSHQSQIIEQPKFMYSPLGKALDIQTKKEVDALKSLKLSKKIDELNQIECIFPVE